MIYKIENDILCAKISSIGATLMSLIYKPKDTDIVMGYDEEIDYIVDSGTYFGTTVGRNANRLKDGKYKINGQTYQLPINDGPNNLHSGVGSFSLRPFDVKEIKENSITLSLKDGDMYSGYPGNLDFEVKYELNNDELIYSFKGLSDKDSIFNITNHSYFNLNGSNDNLFNHELKINTEKMSLIDENGMAADCIIDVSDTGFDFREFRNLKDSFDTKEDNFSKGGIDHDYIFNNLENKKMGSLRNGILQLDVESDLPTLHIYTSNFIDHIKGKNNKSYYQYWGICLECYYNLNGLNYDDRNILMPIIKANEEVNHYIKFRIRSI